MTMKSFLYVILPFILFSCGSATSDSGKVIDLTVSEWKDKRANDPGIMLDVRTQEEYDEGYIEGCTHIDWYNDDFKASVEKLDKTKPIYVYCHSGGRSKKAANLLVTLGFGEVYNLKGGIQAWNNVGQTKD